MLSLIAWMFPGQGSQSVGMAAGLDAEPAAVVWEEARAVLGWDVRVMCLEGPAETLARTEVAQPAILTTSVAAAAVLEATGMLPDLVAGHSVGEFAALVAARAMSFEDALRIVSVRAEAMGSAGAARPGGMAAVLGLDLSAVEEVCAGVDGVVVVANVNTADQIVISGERDAVLEAGRVARGAGARRVLPLQVSVAAHSPLMDPARLEVERAIRSATILDPAITFASSVTSSILGTGEQVARAIAQGVTSRVEWFGCVTVMRAAGVEGFVEVGPGTVLGGLVRRIAPEAAVVSVADQRGAVNLSKGLTAGAFA